MKNQPGTMKNHPRTMKNHENQPDTKRNQSGTMENYENPPLEQTNPCRLQTVKDHTAWLKILEQVTNTWIVKALTYLYSLLSVYVRYIQVQPGLIGGLWNQMGIKPPCDPVYIEVNRVQGRCWTPLGQNLTSWISVRIYPMVRKRFNVTSPLDRNNCKYELF